MARITIRESYSSDSGQRRYPPKQEFHEALFGCAVIIALMIGAFILGAIVIGAMR